MDSNRQDPGFTLSFEQRPGYLCVRVGAAAMSLDLAVAYWAAIDQHCRTLPGQPMLVIESVVGGSTDREDRLPELVDRLLAFDLARFKIALVKQNTADMSLAENASLGLQATGWSVRLFSNEGHAVIWLLHGLP